MIIGCVNRKKLHTDHLLSVGSAGRSEEKIELRKLVVRHVVIVPAALAVFAYFTPEVEIETGTRGAAFHTRRASAYLVRQTRLQIRLKIIIRSTTNFTIFFRQR